MQYDPPILRVHFEGHGHTFVKIEQSVTVKQALAKAMKLRKLIPDICVAYVCCGISKTPISWDTDISRIGNEDILVEQTGYWPIKLSHNFAKKIFFLMGNMHLL